MIVRPTGEDKMNEPPAYRRPSIVILGSAMELLLGTLVKGRMGAIESIHWHIIPA